MAFPVCQDRTAAFGLIKVESVRQSMRDRVVLPISLSPRGLSRILAAAYIGVSPSLFDAMVTDGRMPRPIRINSRVVWDRLHLDEAFAALERSGIPEEWSEPKL
jgi:predicted DNA-binding transcriptional regulator AlpA